MGTALDPGVGVEVASDAVTRAMKAGADAAKVVHTYAERFEVNFDTTDVTLVRTTVSDDLSITVYDGTRKGSTELTGRSHDAVDRAVDQALTSARAGEPDPANVLPDDPAEPARSAGDEEPAREVMVDAVLAHIERVQADYPSIRTDSSLYSFTCGWSSYANSHGRTQHARRGRYSVQVTCTARDDARAASTSFNFMFQMSDTPIADITSLPAVKSLFDDTVASFDGRPIPATFVGDVIFTPVAAMTLVQSVVGSLAGLSLMRKTTPYIDRLGDTIAAPCLSVLHRPDQLAGASPFDGEGFAARDVDIIKDGVLENFVVDWYSAQKLGRPMTTGTAALVVPSGDASLAEIIAGTERGIVLGRFSGGMPNAKLDFSGVAKNSFYVEDGKIVHPLTETMIAGNFADALLATRAVSQESIDFGVMRLPWIATSGVTISTK